MKNHYPVLTSNWSSIGTGRALLHRLYIIETSRGGMFSTTDLFTVWSSAGKATQGMGEVEFEVNCLLFCNKVM